MSEPLAGAIVRPALEPASVADAIVRLRASRLVAIPTETVYGLAARTLDAKAVAGIYAAKGRPTDNPLIAHASNIAMAQTLTAGWTEDAERLAVELWPGPLTIVLHRHPNVPLIATGGRESIAIRIPAHAVALEVIHRLGEPLSAPSANQSGSLSPTEARHVLADFVDLDLLILDGGPCRIGLESTVVDLRGPTPSILRPGIVSADRISDILQRAVQAPALVGQGDGPGSALSHYAPTTSSRLCGADEAGGVDVAVITFGREIDCSEGGPQDPFRLDLSEDPEVSGCLLYAALHAADVSRCKRIDIVPPPETPAWATIHDRLRRATADA